MAPLTKFTSLIAQIWDEQSEARELIDRAIDKYGEWIDIKVEFPAANISEATDEELMMMLALLQDDHLKAVSPGSMKEFRQWAAGEDIDPWGARFVLNWLVLRREHARQRREEEDQ